MLLMGASTLPSCEAVKFLIAYLPSIPFTQKQKKTIFIAVIFRPSISSNIYIYIYRERERERGTFYELTQGCAVHAFNIDRKKASSFFWSFSPPMVGSIR